MVDDICALSNELISLCKSDSDNIMRLEDVKPDNSNSNEAHNTGNCLELSDSFGSTTFRTSDLKTQAVVAANSNCNSLSPSSCSELPSSKVVFSQQSNTSTVRRRPTFKCPYCPKVFCNSSAIAKHKLTHSDERKYVCDICGKAFKRQDHLNGHKYTHKVNKPHACFFCDRSYSDARSLKRHYENQHQEEYKEKMVTRDCGSSIDDNCGSSSIMEPFRLFDDHISVKCEVCEKGFKNQSALNGHMRLHGGYGQTKNVITGPGEPKPVQISMSAKSTEHKISTACEKQLISLIKVNPKLDVLMSRPESTSITPSSPPVPSLCHTSTNCSNLCNLSTVPPIKLAGPKHSPKYDICHSPSDTVIGADLNRLLDVSIEDLRKAFQPTPTQNQLRNPRPGSIIPLSTDVKTLSAKYMTYSPQSTSADFHCQKKVAQKVYSPPLPSSYGNQKSSNCAIISIHDQTLLPYPAMMEHSQLPDAYPEDYLTTIHYSKFTADFTTSSLNSLDGKSWNNIFDSTINSQEMSDYNNSNCSVPVKSVSTCSNNNLQEILFNLETLSDSNEVVSSNNNLTCPSGIIDEETWSHYHDDVFQNSDCATATTVPTGGKLEKIARVPKLILQSAEDKSNDSVSQPFLLEPQADGAMKKSKIRPPPIFIPPQTSAHMSLLRSPRVWNMSESVEQKIPPYTPPPMLSPQRKGSGLFNTVRNSSLRNSIGSASSCGPAKTPVGNIPIISVSYSTCPPIGDHNNNSTILQEHCSTEKDDFIDPKSSTAITEVDGLPTSATPRINIGPQYQATLPNFYPDRHQDFYLRQYDTLLWTPGQFKETTGNESSLDLLMKIARSPAIRSCGLNMEYTFHLLFRFGGDFERTLQSLLEESFLVYDYVYAETSKWTTEEICKFQERLKAHDRDFLRVSSDLQSYGMDKSVKACVEFYYVRKYMNNTKDNSSYKTTSKPRKRLTERNPAAHRGNVKDPYRPDVDQLDKLPYNLRRQYNSENQKQPRQIYYYESKSSDSSSSREPSPPYKERTPKTVSIGLNEAAKKPRSSYQCSQCNRSFAKLKTLENHIRNHVHKRRPRNKIEYKNSQRTPEPEMYKL